MERPRGAKGTRPVAQATAVPEEARGEAAHAGAAGRASPWLLPSRALAGRPC